MPLLDHFHPPLGLNRHWESFHSRWAAAIADSLNQGLLPDGYFAEAQVQVGGRLPVLPLALDNAVCVPLDLDATYREACQHSRLP